MYEHQRLAINDKPDLEILGCCQWTGKKKGATSAGVNADPDCSFYVKKSGKNKRKMMSDHLLAACTADIGMFVETFRFCQNSSREYNESLTLP